MQAAPVSHVSPATAAGASAPSSRDDDGFDFWDFLDIINPLQHIPVVSSIYRAVTGDEIGPAARLIGGGLYGLGLLGGGWIGLASTAINTAVEEATGDDIPGHLLAMVLGDDEAEAGDQTGVAGSSSETGEDSALVAAVRPEAVVVRSDPLPAASAAPLFAGGDVPGDASGLAAATGQVVSPAMGQALLLAAQSDDPQLVEAVNRMLPRGQAQPGRLREMGLGLTGYSLDDVPVQVGSGVIRTPAGSLLSSAAR